MRFLDFFAGIGGFRFGMERAGHECVGYIEINEFARKSYEEIHITEGEWTARDISTIDYRELPRSDVWCFGFPCQDISISGGANAKGFKGKRSSLYFAVTKRLRQIKEWDPERMPSYLFIENVKNFLSVNNGWDFLAAQVELDEIGYDAEWQLINSKDFGVPQNRERVFIIGHHRGRNTRKVLPITGSNKKTLKQLVGGSQGARVYDIDGLCCTLSAEGGGQGAKTGLYMDKGRIRKLTPREAWRAQGFSDGDFDKAVKVNSDSQLYKQAGNSVSVPVIYEIAKRLGADE